MLKRLIQYSLSVVLVILLAVPTCANSTFYKHMDTVSASANRKKSVRTYGYNVYGRASEDSDVDNTELKEALTKWQIYIKTINNICLIILIFSIAISLIIKFGQLSWAATQVQKRVSYMEAIGKLLICVSLASIATAIPRILISLII